LGVLAKLPVDEYDEAPPPGKLEGCKKDKEIRTQGRSSTDLEMDSTQME